MKNELDLNALLQQEKASQLKHFDFDKAWQLGQRIHSKASDMRAPVSLEVYAFGQVLFMSALPGSSAENVEWMQRKRNTVLRCAHSSMYVGMVNASKGESMANQPYIDPYSYTDHGGAFPLLNESGAVIGAVSVSGLPSEEDHALALWGIQQLQQAEQG